MIGNRVDTLVGIDLGKRRDPSGLADLPPLGPNPFGPQTAELDLSPYLTRMPLGVSPKIVAGIVVAVFFVLGSGLAVAAMGGEPTTRAMKYDAKPPGFSAEPEPEPVAAQPRLAELMAEDPEPAVSARRAEAEATDADAMEPAPRRAPRARTPDEIRELRARRQARRRARIRARWVARHGT